LSPWREDWRRLTSLSASFTPSTSTLLSRLEELRLHAPKAHASGSDQLLDFDYERPERLLDAFLGPRPSKEDLCYLSFLFANIMAQVARGEPLSSGSLTQNASISFPFGLRNAARTIDHLIVQCMHPSSTDDEFVGMMNYVAESFHDLLAGDFEAISNSDSSRGSHHPSRECFMAGSPEGHVKSVHNGATLTADSDDKIEGDARVPSHLRVEQLRAR
jgi:hypothetical protein